MQGFFKNTHIVSVADPSGVVGILPNMLGVHDLFRVYRRIHYLRDHWIRRNEDLPSYTLGAAAYLDSVPDRNVYAQTAKKWNPFIAGAFIYDLQKIIRTLNLLLTDPVFLAAEKYHNMALPGFHIFQAHPAFESFGGSIHYDREHWNILPDLHLAEVKTLSHFSLTIPILLPEDQHCSGLNYWVGEKTHFVPYSEGHGYIHFGELKHQIAPAGPMRFTDERITWQMHAVLLHGKWHVYW